MKKILFIIVMLISVSSIHAQQSIYSTRYTKNLDAYVGIWEYHTATDTFRVLLKKGKSYWSDGTLRTELVYGGHRYVKNGHLVADYTKGIASSTNRNYETTPISASNGVLIESEVNSNELGMSFNDQLKDKIGHGTLILIPGNPNQLRWKIEGMNEQVFITGPGDPEPVVAEGWSVPTDVVLTKISDTIPDDGTRPPFIIDDLMEVEP